MARIFVSYSRADSQFVQEFIPIIRRVYRGQHVIWYDDEIHGGSKWWDMILSEVNRADLFLYLISSDSLTSPYCQAEFREALRLNKAILPVLVRRTNIDQAPSDIAAIIRETHWIDLSQKGVRDTNETAALWGSIGQILNEYTPQPPSDPQPVFEPSVTDQPSRKKNRAGLWVLMAVLLLAVIVIVGGILFLAGDGDGDATQAVPPSDVADVSSAAPTDIQETPETPIPTLAPSETPTETNTPVLTSTIAPSDTPLPLGFVPVTANSQWQPVSSEFNGVEMVLVPAGCFMMGSDSGESDERPVHEQCFDTPFWIDRYEVTIGQYGSQGPFQSCQRAASASNQPRNCATWYEALAHCEGRGARLPTEAEWEYAARGPDNLEYPWGSGLNGSYLAFGGTTTSPVGSFPAGVSWVGAFDMSGNLWEQTSTIYNQEIYPYPYDASDGRENLTDTANDVVMRGGSYDQNDSAHTATTRSGNARGINGVNVGFRCARDYDGL